MKVHGRCHCGAIEYEAEIDPAKVMTCHCTDCQRLTGTAYRTNVSALAPDFKLLKGEPRRYIKTAASGAKRLHTFCGDCGSPIYAADPESPKAYNLRVGALDERTQLGRPVRQIWTKRKLSWVPPIEGAQEVEGQP